MSIFLKNSYQPSIFLGEILRPHYWKEFPAIKFQELEYWTKTFNFNLWYSNMATTNACVLCAHGKLIRMGWFIFMLKSDYKNAFMAISKARHQATHLNMQLTQCEAWNHDEYEVWDEKTKDILKMIRVVMIIMMNWILAHDKRTTIPRRYITNDYNDYHFHMDNDDGFHIWSLNNVRDPTVPKPRLPPSQHSPQTTSVFRVLLVRSACVPTPALTSKKPAVSRRTPKSFTTRSYLVPRWPFGESQ